MSFYKIIKVSILLGTGLIVACSSNNDANTKSSVTQQTISPDALTVNIDPKSGEFIDAPVKKPSVTTTSNNVVNNSVAPVKKYSDLKESIDSNGGSYIELIIPPKQ